MAKARNYTLVSNVIIKYIFVSISKCNYLAARSVVVGVTNNSTAVTLSRAWGIFHPISISHPKQLPLD